MSRSEYVYVVLPEEPGPPIAGFTVKYELGDWLLGQPVTGITIWRLPGGRNRQTRSPVQLSPLTLEEL